jgi:GT2 family glycosyltransferase
VGESDKDLHVVGVRQAMKGTPVVFSVIIPTRDRPDALGRCLAALDSLAPGPSFEVIVCDDGGHADVSAWVPVRFPNLAVRVVRQDRRGPAAARNAGLLAANGRWVAFTDDDCVPGRAWLAALDAAVARWPDRAVGGRTAPAHGVLSAAHQALVNYVTRQWSGDAGPTFLASNNLVFPAAALRSLGGFDETFPFAAGEDRDLCDRWVAAGHRMVDAPDAAVVHAHQPDFMSFCRIHYRYGRGAFQFRHRSAARHHRQVHLERATFYLGLLLEPFTAESQFRAPILAATLLVSQLCHAAGYVRERWSDQRAAALAPAAAASRSTAPPGPGASGGRPSTRSAREVSATGD